MGRRLALLADASHVGSWVRASGEEVLARVRNLGMGDTVWMTVIVAGNEIVIPLSEGEHSLLGYGPKSWLRYRVSKSSDVPGARMTSVEVVLAHN